MKTKTILETPDEVIEFFYSVRSKDDKNKVPYVGNDDVHLVLELNDNRTFYFTLQGTDSEKYEIGFNSRDEFEYLMVRVFQLRNISLKIGR